MTRNFGQRFANAKSKDTTDDAFNIAGEKKRRYLIKRRNGGVGQNANTSILPNVSETAREARARTYESEKDVRIHVFFCVCVYMCVFVRVYANE